jgi:serine protease Do
MARAIRTPLLFSFTAALAAGAPLHAPLHAQRGDAGVMRRAPRAEPADTTERQLRRLERRVDSLAQLYNEGEELSVARRRSIGEELDRTVAQIEELAQRASQSGSRMVHVRVQMAPMMDEHNAMAMSSALRQEDASQLAMPRGWLGIVLSGTAREPRIDNGELIVRYLTYPVILSVEPSSPAEKAGLTPSDTLVAYDGRDVRDRDISVTRLLRPNSRVLVRIRRDGRTKDVPVTIADVPSRIRLRSEANFDLHVPRAELLATMPFPRGPVPRTAMVPRVAPMPPMGPMFPMAPLPPLPPTPAMILSSGLNSVAGAELAALTDGLARTVGVHRGVLVTSAVVGSLAHSSGLRDGDVIVRVAGAPVRTVTELRRRVQSAVDNGESGVELDCVRERKPQRLVLRWSGGR